MAMENVVIVSGARTAIGGFMGSLKDHEPTALGALCIRAALERAETDANDVDHVVFGNVIHSSPRDMYISRVAAIEAGVPETTPALTVNRLCGSGLQAIVTAAQLIMLGDAKTAVAGGAESMSRAPHALLKGRAGQKMGHVGAVDMMLGALHDPFEGMHMGVTGENVAAEYGVDRDMQDAAALESQKRAAHAIAEGRFRDQITPVMVRRKREEVAFDTDEHVRGDTTAEGRAQLPTVFKKEGTVTPGNASGINDGAAALVLMSESQAKASGKKSMARIVSYGHAGVRPDIMGIGPVNAVRQALERANLTVEDLDVIESNEAFAAQACAVAKELNLPADKTNPNGGAIALGHPVGATGAIITVKTISELERIGGRYGLMTMCIGGGQGIAMIVEAVR